MRLKTSVLAISLILVISLAFSADMLIAKDRVNGAGASFPNPIYQKWALKYYKMNKITQAHADAEKAISLDENHHDAIYLKGLISLREENYQGAVEAILRAAEISRYYTGLNFMLSMIWANESAQTMVENISLMDPSSELIELLEAGISRRFDLIREALMSATDGEEPVTEKAALSPSKKTEPTDGDQEPDGAGHAVSARQTDSAPESDDEAFDPLEEVEMDIELVKEKSE